MKRFLAIAAFCLALQPGAAHPQEAPQALVARLSQSVADKINTSRTANHGARNREFIEQSVLPYVDFQRMTALAAGRHWRSATAAQQQQLEGEFRALLIRTYGSALLSANDLKIELKSARLEPDGNEAEVRSLVLRPRAEPLQLDYRLEKTPQGWKIYDINIMGAWLVASYKNSFASEIERGGFDGLITALAGKNKRPATP